MKNKENESNFEKRKNVYKIEISDTEIKENESCSEERKNEDKKK